LTNKNIINRSCSAVLPMSLAIAITKPEAEQVDFTRQVPFSGSRRIYSFLPFDQRMTRSV
jgi:hypothetical protein